MNRIMHKMGRLWRARGGIAAVELALLLPLFPLMLFGTIEIGRMLFDFHAASKTVRDATRYLSRIPESKLSLACPVESVNNAAVEVINAKNLALTGSIDGTSPYLLSYWTDANSVVVTAKCIDNSGGNYQGFYTDKQWVASITVSATVPMPLMNGWLLGLGDTLSYTVSHKEAHIGY